MYSIDWLRFHNSDVFEFISRNKTNSSSSLILFSENSSASLSFSKSSSPSEPMKVDQEEVNPFGIQQLIKMMDLDEEAQNDSC